MKNTKIYLPSTEPFQILMEDINTSQEEIIANQAALHSMQPIRNLPNILRNNNTRTYKNYKIPTLDNIDTSFVSSTEDMNISFELNTILSNSVDSEMEANYNKIASSKSHHQRKQVHNPLDIQYDTLDWNNNRDKNILQNINQLDILHISPSNEESIPTKKLKYNNKQKRCSFKKKSKRITAHKSDSRTNISYKKLDFDSGLTTVSDIPVQDNVIAQSVNNFCSNDILIQSICEPNTSNFTNYLNDIGTKSIESSNVFYCNNEINNLEKKYDNSYNPVISSSSTKFNILQHKTFQKDLINYDFPIIENGLKEELIDRNMASNFLFKSEVLYTCTCANCMSCEKDIIFYEDPVSTSTSNDSMETELLTDFYTNIYDFYINDYYHILGGNWLKECDKVNPCYEEIKETNITKESVCTGSNNVTKLIESNVNVPCVEQNKSQNSQSYYIDKLQDICVESYSTEPQSDEPTKFLKSAENVNIFDETDYLNPESIFMKEGKIISQDEAHFQNPILTDTSILNSKCQPEKDKKDLYVIQCGQCGKLFNKKHQFSKHFTRCDFADKEDFKCHICNKIYRHKSSLAQHLKNVHQISDSPHEKFYTCNKCSKLYVRLRAFQRHVLLHDDD